MPTELCQCEHRAAVVPGLESSSCPSHLGGAGTVIPSMSLHLPGWVPGFSCPPTGGPSRPLAVGLWRLHQGALWSHVSLQACSADESVAPAYCPLFPPSAWQAGIFHPVHIPWGLTWRGSDLWGTAVRWGGPEPCSLQASRLSFRLLFFLFLLK